jgi:hypothetical protein
MSRTQTMALEAVTAFVHAYKLFVALQPQVERDYDVRAACSSLEVQLTMLIYTTPHIKDLGNELGISFDIPLSHIRRKEKQ